MPKISELNPISSVTSDDFVLVVNDPGGAPSTNKITVLNFANTVAQFITYASNVTSGTIKVGDNLSVNATGFLNNSIPSQLTSKANNATGTAGQISWDANYIYVCVATNSWKRVALTTY